MTGVSGIAYVTFLRVGCDTGQDDEEESDEEDDADWATHSLKFERTAADRRWVSPRLGHILQSARGAVWCE